MNNLPTGDMVENFVGDFEEMNLAELQGHMYGVAIGLGSRDSTRFVCESLMAPLDFWRMIEAVGTIYKEQQIHAKAFILKSGLSDKMNYLDEFTIDFIEARYLDLLAEGLLNGSLDDSKEFTCKAGFIQDEETQVSTEDASS